MSKPKQTASDTERITNEIIHRLVVKITELDEDVIKLVSTKIGMLGELEEVQSRVNILEEQNAIMRHKFDQHQFPTLMAEFTAHAAQKQLPKRPSRRKKQ